jgi:flavin-dependent dehydrogenase
MKIAIAGAGTTGAYAYRLLKKRGLNADVYQRDCRTACGINPLFGKPIRMISSG